MIKSGIAKLKTDLSDNKHKLQSSAFLVDVENEDKNTVSLFRLKLIKNLFKFTRRFFLIFQDN